MRPDLPGAGADLGGLTLHDLGGDGPDVLLAHATGFHGRVWGPLAAHLPAHGWAPDLRGHGTSPLGADGDLRWDRFADDVLAVVDHLRAQGHGGRPLRGVGHSKGGAALLLAEQRRPGTFAALYVYEPIVFPPEVAAEFDASDQEHPLAAGALRRRDRFAGYDEAEANFAAKPPLDALDPEVLHAYVHHGFAPAGEGDGVVLRCRPEVEAEVYRQGMRHDGFAHLREVRCPVTVAMGRMEPFSPAGFAPAIAHELPFGTLVSHDLGHFGPLEDPAAIAADVRRAFELG